MVPILTLRSGITYVGVRFPLSAAYFQDNYHQLPFKISCLEKLFVSQHKKFRLFVRRSVSIWVNCLEDILITHFFLSVILVALCVTLLLLINSLNFRICLFFVTSEDLLYEFS